MANSFEKTLNSVKQRFARSPIADYLAWWRDELLGCLPKSWQERLSTQAAQVMVGADIEGWRAARVRGPKIEAEQRLDLSDPAALRRVLGGLETLNDRPAERRVLCLSGHQVLTKRLNLPLAAEESLAQVLALEMDRQTPFKADQVYFDWKIVKRDSAQKQLMVDLSLVPKDAVDTLLATAQAANLDFDAIDALKSRGTLKFDQALGVNLLPESKRRASADPNARVRWILAFSVIGLIGLILVQSLQARREALAALTERTANVQRQAMQAAELAKQVRSAIAGANFLAERKLKQPETVKVMLELTQLIPEDTHLERISFVGKSVQLMGQSRSSDKLIAILQKARYTKNPQFQGVIQPDPSTGKERFNLQVDLQEESELPEAPMPQALPAPTPAVSNKQAGLR